jgi:hypothetical protein
MAWGFLSKLFVSQKAVEDVTETGKNIAGGIMSGLDKLILTEQERLQGGADGAKIVLNFWEAIAKESTEQSKARRELATKIIDAFLNMLFIAIACRVFGIFEPKLTEVALFILKIALSGIVGGLVISIGTIYFGPHQLSKIVDWSKKKD